MTTYTFLKELAYSCQDTMLPIIQQHIYDDVWILLVEGFNDKKARHDGASSLYKECQNLYMKIEHESLEKGKIPPLLQLELNDFWHHLGGSLTIQEFKILCDFFELEHESLIRL